MTLRSVRASTLVLIAAAAIPYLSVLGAGFVFDDERLLFDTPEVRTLSSIPGVLGLSGTVPQPRALRTVSFSVDYALAGGFKPGFFHLTNLLLHVLATLVAFRVAVRLVPQTAAFLAALLFAVHPAHTEAVAFISARKDLLATLFSLLSFHAFLRYRAEPRRSHLAQVFVCFALALLSKEVAVVLPLLFFAHDRTVPGYALSASARRPLALYVPILILSAAAGLVAVCFQQISSYAASLRFPGDSALRTWLTVPAILCRYATLLLLPVRLKADYSFDAFPLATGPLDPRVFGSLAALVALALGVRALRTVSPIATFGSIWTLVALFPVSQIVPHHEILAEHYLYLPSFGACLLLGAALSSDSISRIPQAKRLRAAILILLAALTAFRVRVWDNSAALWESAAAASPRSARARFNLGREFAAQGRWEEAEAEWRAAIAIGRAPTIEENRGYIAALGALGGLDVSRWRSAGRPTKSPFFDEAAMFFSEIMELLPSPPEPRVNLINLGVQGSRLDLVLAALHGVDEDSPTLRHGTRAILALPAQAGVEAEALEATRLLAAAVRRGKIEAHDRAAALDRIEQVIARLGEMPACLALERWRGAAIPAARRRARDLVRHPAAYLPTRFKALRAGAPVGTPSHGPDGDPSLPGTGPELAGYLRHVGGHVIEAVRAGPRKFHPAETHAAWAAASREMRSWLGAP